MKNLIPIFMIMIAGLVACGNDGSSSIDYPDYDNSLKGAVVTVNGSTYNCIKYTTVYRGGLWCERVN